MISGFFGTVRTIIHIPYLPEFRAPDNRRFWLIIRSSEVLVISRDKDNFVTYTTPDTQGFTPDTNTDHVSTRTEYYFG